MIEIIVGTFTWIAGIIIGLLCVLIAMMVIGLLAYGLSEIGIRLLDKWAGVEKDKGENE